MNRLTVQLRRLSVNMLFNEDPKSKFTTETRNMPFLCIVIASFNQSHGNSMLQSHLPACNVHPGKGIKEQMRNDNKKKTVSFASMFLVSNHHVI